MLKKLSVDCKYGTQQRLYFKRRSFMIKTELLKVTFATTLEEEDAIDHGGPRREFLHLLLGAICNGRCS